METHERLAMSQSRTRPDASHLSVPTSETMHCEPDQDVQLTVVMPRRVRQALLQYATGQGLTARSVILRLLRNAGIAEIDEADLVDRRTTPATARKSIS
jgi:hypothetical protein